MKKIVKTLATLFAAVLAVIGGLYVYRRFFAKDEELDEAFDEDNTACGEDEDEVNAFDTEDEIFEDEDAPVQTPNSSETADSEGDAETVPDKDSDEEEDEDDDY